MKFFVIVASVLAPLCLAASALDWHWSNPLPHGNEVAGLAWSPSQPCVAVCDHGQIYTSDDLALWVPLITGTQLDLQAAAYFHRRLVVVGANGLVLWADSLLHPNLVNLGTTNWLTSLAAAPGLLVTVGDHGAIYSSVDGASWIHQSSPFPNSLQGITWGGAGSGFFVTVGSSGLIAVSPDGARWSVRSSGTVANLNGVSWTGSSFVAVGDGGLVLEADASGQNWQPQSRVGAVGDLIAVTAVASSVPLIGGYGEMRIGAPGGWLDETSFLKPRPAPSTEYYALLWNGTNAIAAGEAGITVSGSPSNAFEFNWLQYISPPRNWLFDIAVAKVISTNVYNTWSGTNAIYSSINVTNQLCIAVGDLGTALLSSDGINWRIASMPTNYYATPFFGVAANALGTVATGLRGTVAFSPAAYTTQITTTFLTNHGVVYSATVTNASPLVGALWQALNPITTVNLFAVAASENLFIVGGDNGFISTSTNGLSWTARSAPRSVTVSGIESWPNGFVACGEAGAIFTSQDGVVWQDISLPTDNWIYKVRWLNGQLLAVGEGGSIYTSTDGNNWSAQISTVTNWLNDVTWTAGRYFVAGDQGIVLSSQDAVAWTMESNMITSKSLYAAVTIGTRLIVAGYEGAILRAEAGGFTNAVQIVSWPTNTEQQQFLFSGGMDQQFTLQHSIDLTNWSSDATFTILDPSGTLSLNNFFSNNPTSVYFRTISSTQ